MKLLLLSPMPPPVGGITRWSQIVINVVGKDSECEISHINISPKYKGRITALKRIVFGITSLFGILKEESRAIRSGIEVLHLTSSGSFALLRDYFVMKLAKRHGIPTVYHLHFGRIPSISKAENREWKAFKRVFNYCDAIIGIDKPTIDALDSKGYSGKMWYCPNPVDVTGLASYKSKKTGSKKVIYVGHIYPAKGIRELIDAWINVSKGFPEYTLELVGSTAETQFIDSLPKDKSIIFVGEKSHEETMQLLSEAALMVLPSYSEGFPNVILEAMALKVPIIATKVGAIPEMLADGCGKLIEPKSTMDLMEALYDMLTNSKERNNMVEKAFRKVNESYSSETVIKLYKNIWKSLAQ